MSWWKKIFGLFFAVVFMIVCIACGKKDGFFLTYCDNDIKLGSVFKGLGVEYSDSFDSKNCVSSSKDVSYVYDDIEVEVCDNKKNESIVYAINFISLSVKTNEGVGIEDSVDNMLKAYGNDYTKDGDKYIYKRGDTKLTFTTRDNMIIGIGYNLNEWK